jgi:hypothetical protein
VTTTDPQYHRLHPEEFTDAMLTATGAYMGTRAATGSHQEALTAAVLEAFNAGVQVGRDNPEAQR